jgi:dihydroorotate dehydrogenase electron transfer subunit
MNNLYEIKENILIAKDTYKMILAGDTSKISKPGQFVNIKIGEGHEHFLRRPISICEYKNGEMTLVYKILGKGTNALSKASKGEVLDVLSPLGNGFSIKEEYPKQLLIGGGVGVPPLLELAKQLAMKNIEFDVVLGFANKDDIFFEKEFQEYAKNVYVSTMDGTLGYRGNVLELIQSYSLDFEYYYACGPEKMLHALIRTEYVGQLSFEERMGCGFGACMGCSHKTIDSFKRICKEGPVLESWEVFINE